VFAKSYFAGAFFAHSYYGTSTTGNIGTGDLVGGGYFARSFFTGAYFSRSFFSGSGGNVSVELFVDAEKRIEMFLLGEWVDVTSDTVGTIPIYAKYGIDGNTPFDHTASGGTLNWTLNNDSTNSAGVKGYYDPFAAEKRPGFGFEIPVRLFVSYAGVSKYKWIGKISDINPMMGEFEVTHFTALDIFDELSTREEPEIEPQFDKRGDELMDVLFDALELDAYRQFETGVETFPIALDGGTGQELMAFERVNQVNMSEWGYAYPIGNIEGDKPTVVWESRHHRASNPLVMFELDSSDLLLSDEYALPGSSNDFYSEVRVMVHPINHLPSTPISVLYALQTTQTMLRAGEVNDTIFGPYRDPVSHDQIGGVETVNPIPYNPDTGIGDYAMNTESDGTGTDLTASFTVTAIRSTVGVRFIITNNSDTTGFVTKLQQRGKPVFRYDAVSRSAIVSPISKKRVLQVEMPFSSNLNVAKDVGDYLATSFGAPYPNLPPIRFLANRSVDHMRAALEREPGDRIRVNLPRLENREFTINSVQLEFQLENQIYCVWNLESASSQRYWLMGIEGAGEMGLTTFFGF
jgi:hypothetical protein